MQILYGNRYRNNFKFRNNFILERKMIRMEDKKTQRFLDFGLILAIIMTISLATKKSPLDYTFSMIGNWFQYKTTFIIWGLITGTLLTIYFIKLFNETNYTNKKSVRYAYLSGIFLILTVITPTANQEPIEKALRQTHVDLHLILSLLFIIFILMTLYSFSKYLATINKQISLKSMKFLLISVGGSIFLLTTFGMVGIFELFFFISIFIYLIITEKNISELKEKSKIKNHKKKKKN